ncbi:MAG: DUF1569 domain-containing protein [Flavobacteriia bacterium]|jgi:hypothetical protein
MDNPNIFKEEVSSKIIERIEKLSPETNAVWGKMNVAQMLAHCNVTYEMIYTDKHPKAKGFKKFILKSFIKPIVVTTKAYKQNSPTAPAFKIADSKEFEAEKNRLIEYIKQTQALGENHFEGMESNSFGVLNKNEWNNMLYKHLDHHLSQFGV